MCPQVVQNQVYLSSGIPDEPLHESDQPRRSHRFPVHHKPDLSFIVDGGNHADTFLLRAHPDNWGCTPGGISPHPVGFILEPRLIAPVDLCFFHFCPSGDLRVFRREPAIYCLRVLFFCLFDGFPGSKTPPSQVLAYGPDRHGYRVSSFDKFLNCLSRPESKGKPQLVRGPVDNKVFNLPFLFLCQGPLLSMAAPSCTKGNSIPASLQVLLPDGAGVLDTDTEEHSYVLILFALLPEADDLVPVGLLNFLPKGSGVSLFHGISLSQKRPIFQYLLAVVIEHTNIGSHLLMKLYYGVTGPHGYPDAPWTNGVLKKQEEVKASIDQVRKLGLPIRDDPPKNWDSLAALDLILRTTTSKARIFDAGGELYSMILPWLFFYGYRNLIAANLEFRKTTRRGSIVYEKADITQTTYPNETFDAITCLSVIEHGVDLNAYFREMSRLLKVGGVLITSADYWETPIDTRGQMEYGVPIHVFTKEEIIGALKLARQYGFGPLSPLDLASEEKVVHWKEHDLHYTFVIFSMQKDG